MIKNENFIAIQGFMVKELKLKGNELLVYAIIYGFSQCGCGMFNGSRQYLADWTNSTKQGISKNLNSLLEKGLIDKKVDVKNGVRFVYYWATEFTGGSKQSLLGSKQSLHNNNIDNNINNNIYINDTKVSLEQAPKSYGNEEINSMFEIWEKVFGYMPKNSAENRRAVYNMLRARNKGKDWLLKVMAILSEAQKDKYAGNDILHIAGFADLQRKCDVVINWGNVKAKQNMDNSNTFDLANL